MTNSLSRIVVAPDVLIQELDNEAVLLDMQREHYYVLDDVALRMWQLISQHGEIEPSIAALVAEYDADEATLRQDITNLIEQLQSLGLVRVEQIELSEGTS